MSTKSRHRRRIPSLSELPDPVGAFGGKLLEADNPLDAELIAAAVIGTPRREGMPGMGALFITALAGEAEGNPSPEAAALLRAIAAVGPATLRRLVVHALGQVTDAGFFPPEWAAQIGRAAPRQAWRRNDVFGDTDTVVVTFAYGEAEHAMVVQVDRCRQPTVLLAMITPRTDEIRSLLEVPDDDEPLLRAEEIGLAEARARLAAALERDLDAEEAEEAELNEASLISLPIARARLRRLPAADLAALPSFDDADRSEAVAGFLASAHAGGAGDEKTARFWAEVLAGYSAYVPGDPPDRVGPLKLAQMLHWYVPRTFALTDEQRRGLPDAVTAWTRWAADRQQLPEAARTELAERLAPILDNMDDAYADPDAAASRSYLADVSATTTDAAVLAEVVQRRGLALPLDRDGDDELQSLDAADPAQRRELAERRYGKLEPPEGMDAAEFTAAAVRVCEQLWHDDPPELWQRARELAESGTSHHDIIHELVARDS